MRNIPDFTCEYGAAQLILEEIDRSRKAYCLVLWAVDGRLPGLLEECARFCAMVGAERTMALLPENMTPDGDFPYAPAFRVVEMTVSKESLGSGDCALWPMLPENAGEYARRYNAAMGPVDGARTLKERDIPRLLDRGGCYFVHREGQLLGLGQVEDGWLLALAACVPGAGAPVVRALVSVLSEDTVSLSVADTNAAAMKLYTRLGFVAAKVREVWWDITLRPRQALG